MMNRFIIFFLLFFCSSTVKSQIDSNLFSEANRNLYAQHLVEIKDYSKAQIEFEKLWYLTHNPEYALKTTYYYRQQKSYSSNFSFILLNTHVSELKYERHVMQLIDWHELPENFNTSTFNFDTFEVLNLAKLMYQNKFSDAKVRFENYSSNFIPKNEWNNAIRLSEKYRKTSPFIAGALSAIIPGLGKIYCGRTADGLMGFAGVVSFGYLAYEGFRYKRFKSISAWIYGPLAVGFYAGNIYGSAKASRLRNWGKLNRIHEETQKVLLSHID